MLFGETYLENHKNVEDQLSAAHLNVLPKYHSSRMGTFNKRRWYFHRKQFGNLRDTLSIYLSNSVLNSRLNESQVIG